MRLGTSYGQIFRLSLPIMMGSGLKISLFSLTMFFVSFDHLQFAGNWYGGPFIWFWHPLVMAFPEGQIFYKKIW